MQENPEEIFAINKAIAPQMAAQGIRDPFYLTKHILGYDLLVERVHDPLFSFLTDTGSRLKIVLMPRGSYKSTSICIGLPIWLLLNDPNHTIMIGSSDIENKGQKWIRNIKNVYEMCQKFRAIYPEHINDSAGTWTENKMTVRTRTDHRVQVPSISIASPDQFHTGDHFKTIILDDIVDAENSGTELMRDSIVRFIKMCFSLAERGGTILFTGTRYHLNDAFGYFLGKGHEEMMAFLKKQGVITEKVHSFEPYIKPVYDIEAYNKGIRINQYPEIYSDEELLELEFNQEWDFYSQYLLNPVSGKKRIFKGEWLKYYEDSDLVDKQKNHRIPLYTICLCDPGAGVSNAASKTAFLVIGVDCNQNLYVLDARADKWNTDEILAQIMDIWFTYRPDTFGIESVAFQQWIKKTLDEYTKGQGIGILPIQELNANRGRISKEYSIMSVVPYFSQGRFFLKAENESRNSVHSSQKPFYTQLTSYPDTDYTDFLRALSYLPDIVPFAKPNYGRRKISNYRRSYDLLDI